MRPETTIPKIERVLASGLNPAIFVVHVQPEVAMRRTLKRFAEEGRGASIATMTAIQGGLPAGLRAVRFRFGDRVELQVFDNRDPLDPRQLVGWNNLHVLESEGHREQIEQRFRAELERIRAGGGLSDAAYRQALGQAPLPPGREVARGSPGRHQADDRRRGLSPEDREQAFLTLPQDEAVRLDPQLKTAFQSMRAAELYAASAIDDPASRSAFLEGARKHIGDLLRQGKVVPEPRLDIPDMGIDR